MRAEAPPAGEIEPFHGDVPFAASLEPDNFTK
jgi:hypothetical protein